MTSPSSPRNRRRRRVVVTIAVLVLGLGWWNWPRGDARFVGKWRWVIENGPDQGEFQLRANGLLVGSRPPQALWTAWSVTGEWFQLGTSRDVSGGTLLRKFSEITSQPNRKVMLGYGGRFKIESITPTQIELTSESDGYRVAMKRLPE